MFEFLKKWFLEDDDRRPPPRPVHTRYRPSIVQQQPRTRPEPPVPDGPLVRLDPEVAGRIEDAGPGKNVLTRTKYEREDSGTHETLRIIDEDALRNPDEDGIDPYNTGKFDRSKHWDKRFRD